MNPLIPSRTRPMIAGAAAVLAAVLAQSACMVSGPGRSFDRTLKVDGPVRLDISSGSGKIVIRGGAPGVVHIHGDVRVGGFILDGRSRRIDEITENPPIEQSGNSIRIGRRLQDPLFSWVTISYTVETPEDSEVKAKNGSGGIEVSDLKEPLTLTTGSGILSVENAGDDLSLNVGSGGARATHVGGNINFQCGSGRVALEDVREEIRGTAGSGDIHIQQAHGRVNVHTGSGGIYVSGAVQDLRVGTGSGNVEVRGNPAPDAFWDLGTSSGRIALTVPSGAGFSLTARTASGNVQAGLPIMIEEQSRRVLRARVGDGRAHVNLQTGSGNIRIQQGGAS
ncbi:MAG TPA: DUF4097 family beta strand repeat-containing protein [Candidatus Binatia bacterium]|nr:DUF4097 family beta strand repeat-containing protein [Candidatus Binatia bacterium]